METGDIELDKNVDMMSNPRGFEVVSEQNLPNNGWYFRVKVTDKTVTLRSIYQSLIDTSWINHFFPKGDWLTASVIARTEPTVKRIASNFDKGINSVVNRDTGEKLVSEISRRTLVEDCNYWNMPIAELFKQKVDGNPGFDFHTVTPDRTLLMFGEAKYVANANAYNSALSQISKFIVDEKDMKDLFEIRDFMPSQTPLDNAIKGEKGYVAAFSTNKSDDKDIISKVTGHKNYNQLSRYPKFIAIAVDL